MSEKKYSWPAWLGGVNPNRGKNPLSQPLRIDLADLKDPPSPLESRVAALESEVHHLNVKLSEAMRQGRLSKRETDGGTE